MLWVVTQPACTNLQLTPLPWPDPTLRHLARARMSDWDASSGPGHSIRQAVLIAAEFALRTRWRPTGHACVIDLGMDVTTEPVAIAA